jgi:hypothetical protein
MKPLKIAVAHGSANRSAEGFAPPPDSAQALQVGTRAGVSAGTCPAILVGVEGFEVSGSEHSWPVT